MRRNKNMGQKKNSRIMLVIILILILLILLTGIAYAYFTTDLLKHNKDLFFKYVTQIGDEKEGFLDTQLQEYFAKQKKNPSLDQGSITIDTTTSKGQPINITFDGQVDTTNSQVIQNISLNYSDNVKFPFSYKQIGKIVGIQTQYIGNKYLAIPKDEWQNLGTTTFSNENQSTNSSGAIGKMQETFGVSLTKEDLQHITDTYLNRLNEQLQDSDFSKIEETNSKGYKLTLKGENLKKILVKLLETLKNDQVTLDKINEYVKIQRNSFKITASSIDNKIQDINNNTELNDQSLEITVYETKGRMTQLLIKTNEMEVKLEKIITGNDQQYNLAWQIKDDNQTQKIELFTKFAGLQLMQSITENYQLNIEIEGEQYQYHYNNNVEFTDSTNIEAFSNSNSLMLHEAEEEQRNAFIKAVIERLQNVNKSQMEQLGLEENENPLQHAIPQFGSYLSSVEGSNASVNGISEMEISNYNGLFENYASTNLGGATVKGLLSTIQRNNILFEDNDNRKIKEIHFNGQEYEPTEQNITLLKSSIEIETAYRVEFEKDEETGVIYRAVINEK